MKLLLLLFLPIISAAQNTDGGYANVNFSVSGNKKFGADPGINVGFGFRTNSITTGISLDVFPFDRERINYSILAGDFRAYLDGVDKKVGPFLSAQPGFVLHNKTIAGITTKGSFSFAALAGLRIKPNSKAPGINFCAGYQLFAFKISGINDVTRYHGIKMNVGFSF